MGKRIGKSTDEIPRYTSITVFLRRYIIVRHFLIRCIPTHNEVTSVTVK